MTEQPRLPETDKNSMRKDAEQQQDTSCDVDAEATPLWRMTFSVMPDGSRDLHVEGAPSIASMMAEFQTMIENLRAQLFVDKLMEQGKKKQSRIIRPNP